MARIGHLQLVRGFDLETHARTYQTKKIEPNLKALFNFSRIISRYFKPRGFRF